METFEIDDPLFREAVDAIDLGNTVELKAMLEKYPQLIRDRLNRPTKDYFESPYLMWFVADNPIRNGKLPDNIVDVTRLLIEEAKRQAPESFNHQVDYTLGLVVTGRIPRESGSQIELIDVLIDAGASPGNGIGALAHGNFEAAKHLIKRGGTLTLTAAVCFDLENDIHRLAERADKAELQTALIAAAFYARVPAIKFLLESGADPNGYADRNSGFHSHATALHQAVYSGSLEAVKILIEAGARLDLTDRIYQGTPLGWAKYMQTETTNETEKEQYKKIEDYLTGIASA